jgi:hypothetical protein
MSIQLSLYLRAETPHGTYNIGAVLHDLKENVSISLYIFVDGAYIIENGSTSYMCLSSLPFHSGLGETGGYVHGATGGQLLAEYRRRNGRA